jgi:hypothetical protein
MALFQGKDTVISKPYLAMIADKIMSKSKIKIGTAQILVSITPEIKVFLAAVKSNNQTKIDSALKNGKTYANIFEGNPWTKIDKAPFSGSGGSGGGAEVTAITECLQCFYCSLAFNIVQGALKVSDITESNLVKAGKYCDTDRSLDTCLKKGPPDWIETGVYLKTANSLYNSFKSKFSGKVTFHRGSVFMKGIYDAKKVCHANDKANENTQAPGSFSDDKWNPGDIWSTTLSASSKPLKAFTESWGVLNAELARLGGAESSSAKTTVLGISLKKIGSNATLKQYSKPNSARVSTTTYKEYIFGRNGDFFSSQDMYINTSNGSIQFRTFNSEINWQGEIKAVSAAGGKIGGGNIKFYMDKILSSGPFGKYVTESALFGNVNVKDKKFLDEYYALYAIANINQSTNANTLNYQAFVEELQEQPLKFIKSKYACLYLAVALVNSTTAKRNDLIDAFYRYASSDTDQSSYYIKIS